MVVPGVRSLGLTTAVHPTASANGSFWETIKQREVPRRDHSDDTDRLLDRHRQIVGAQVVVGVAERVLGKARRVVPDPRRAGHLVLGLRDGLAGLQGLDQGELVAFGFDPGCDPTQQRGPFRSAGPRPVAAC